MGTFSPAWPECPTPNRPASVTYPASRQVGGTLYIATDHEGHSLRGQMGTIYFFKGMSFAFFITLTLLHLLHSSPHVCGY